VWLLAGEQAQKFNQWVQATASAIGQGRAASILKSPVVQQSGGLLPLAALLVNALNAEAYLSQARGLGAMDAQRMQETLSATLYAGAALVAVVQNWLIDGKGIQELNLRGRVAPTLTLFGGFVG
ncbi:hypothetical protein NNO07_28105, partial [Pseudomonas resinovorans]|nr:hypothetical protein [Pseudomonas resinovorans]